MIGGDHLDRLALHLAAVIGDRHLDGGQRALAGRVGIKARHVGQNADLDDIVGNLRVRRTTEGGESETSRDRGQVDFMVSSPRLLVEGFG